MTFEIDPREVVLDVAGQRRRHWYVRLPAGAVADDVKVPGIWRKVQTDPNKRVARHDHVYLVGHGDDFAVEATATDSTPDGITLDALRVVRFTQRTAALYSDGRYAVFWAGSGYGIRRLSDGHVMPGAFPTETAAIREIGNCYPVRAS